MYLLCLISTNSDDKVSIMISKTAPYISFFSPVFSLSSVMLSHFFLLSLLSFTKPMNITHTYTRTHAHTHTHSHTHTHTHTHILTYTHTHTHTYTHTAILSDGGAFPRYHALLEETNIPYADMSSEKAKELLQQTYFYSTEGMTQHPIIDIIMTLIFCQFVVVFILLLFYYWDYNFHQLLQLF